MAILDVFGNPIEREQLQEPQTARVGHLRSEFENHPSRGLTPARLAKILQDAEQGDLTAQHELFQDMEEKDAHLYSVMQTRRGALQSLDWTVEPPVNATAAEKDLAAFAQDMLGALGDFEDLLFDMSDAVGHGFAALELTWGKTDGALVPVRAEHRPQSWFKTSIDPQLSRNELRLRDNSAHGAALWSFGWLMHNHRARSGYIARAGLFRVLAWPFLFKNFAVRDLAEFLEVYGLPLRLGTYNPSASNADKAALLRAVVGIGHDAAAIIPEGMAIEFKEAARGDNKAFDAMIGLMEQSMSKAVLGGTLTSGEGQHGTQALGNVHNELRHDLKRSDARQLASSISMQLIYPILAVNKGLSDPRRCPRLVFDTQEPEDLKLYADAVPKLVGVGLQIPVNWAHGKLKIPQPKEGEQVLKAAATAVAPAPGAVPAQASARRQATPGVAETALRAGQATAGQDELDTLADEMLGGWEESMGQLVQPVLDAVQNASSFEEFQAALEDGLAKIDPTRLAEVMAKGQFAAKMWGRLNMRTLDDRQQDAGAA